MESPGKMGGFNRRTEDIFPKRKHFLRCSVTEEHSCSTRFRGGGEQDRKAEVAEDVF